MRSEATKHMDDYELQHLQERITAMSEMELDEYRAQLDPDSMGFYGEEDWRWK